MARYLLPLQGFALAVAFWPEFPDAASSTRWIVLSIGVPLLLLRCPIRMTAAHWIGALWLFWCALSLLWATSRLDGVDGLWHALVLGGAFCLGAEAEDLGPTYTALALGISVSGFLGLAQELGFTGVTQVVPPAGLFANKNAMAEIGAMTLLPVLAARRWWLVPGPLLAWLLPLSRGAILGFGVAASVWIWRRNRAVALGLVAAGIIVAGVDVLLRPALPGRIGELATEGSLLDRFNIWHDTLAGLSWLGHGIGSYWSAFPEAATRIDTFARRPAEAHNDLLQLISETGVAGLLLVALVVTVLRGEGHELEKLVLIAFLTIGCFSFPLYLPATAFLGALVAGHLCRGRPELRLRLLLRRASHGPRGGAGVPGERTA